MTIGFKDGPAAICQTFVRNEGRTRIAAASKGVMTTASNPIEIVGRPRPMTPLTKPASTNTAAIKIVLPSSMGMRLKLPATVRNVELAELAFGVGEGV